MAKEDKKTDWKQIRKQAAPILKALGESDDQPKHQIRRMVYYCGLEFTQQVLDDTLRIEEDGGMLIQEGTRRRTPGGVFFKLAKDRMTKKQREKVFRVERRLEIIAKKQAAKEAKH